MTDPDLLKRQIASELTRLDAADAERLSSILQSLFACLEDLDGRVQALESAAAPAAEQVEPGAEVNGKHQAHSLPCGIRTWILPTGSPVTVAM